VRMAWQLDMQVLGSCLKASDHKVYEPPDTDAHHSANTVE
jgi:hypothetical protein